MENPRHGLGQGLKKKFSEEAFNLMPLGPCNDANHRSITHADIPLAQIVVPKSNRATDYAWPETRLGKSIRCREAI